MSFHLFHLYLKFANFTFKFQSLWLYNLRKWSAVHHTIFSVFRVSSWIADRTLWWLSLTQKRFSKFILSLLNTSIHVSSICTTDYTPLWVRAWGIKRLRGADFMINAQWFLADNFTFPFVSVSISIENNNRAITVTTISHDVNDASFCFLVKMPLFFVI